MALNHTTRRCLGLGTLTSLALLVGVTPATAAPAGESCATPRVTGVSYLLDIFTAGSTTGPSIGFGLAQVIVGQPLPGEFGTTQSQLLSASASGINDFRTATPGHIGELRSAAAPFAAFNTYGNAFVASFADALQSLATAGGPQIAPFDDTLDEFSTSVRGASETPTGCPQS